jgi:hypothetical protein
MVQKFLPLVLCCAFMAAPAHAFRLPANFGPLPGNPADRLADPIEDEAYDPATHCSGAQHRKGMVALQHWLEDRSSRGVFWGSYRCERWGRHSASLHAEDRAIDWHLDVNNRADRADARKLIDLLLAPDRAGNQHALARRMGVEELIWDCSYWGAGMSDFKPYGYCYGRSGKLRKHINATAAHRDHVHIGMTKRGAAAKTSFWTARG